MRANGADNQSHADEAQEQEKQNLLGSDHSPSDSNNNTDASPVHHAGADIDRSFTFASAQKEEKTTKLSNAITIFNHAYSWSGGVVFGLMSLFRVLGTDSSGKPYFQNMTQPDKAFLGMWCAACSLLANVPMGFIFFDNFIKIFPRMWYYKDASKNGNKLFTLSFIIAFIFSIGATMAGLAYSKSSVEWLREWSWLDWLYGTILAVFGINTLVTRDYSLIRVIYDPTEWGIIKFRGSRFGDQRYRPFFELIQDLDCERWNSEVLIPIPGNSHQTLISQTNQSIKDFYAELIREGFLAKNDKRVGSTIQSVATGTLMLLAAMTLLLWIWLSEKGSNVVKDGLGNNLYWTIFAASGSYALYIRSAYYFVSDMVIKPYARTQLYKKLNPQCTSFSARHPALAIASLLFPVVTVAWFSGAGYSLAGSHVIDDNYGVVGRSFLFDGGAGPIYKPIFDNLIKWMWAPNSAYGFVAVFFFIMAGMVVNGRSIMAYLENHAPQWLKNWLPALFPKRPSDQESCMSFRERLMGYCLRGELDKIISLPSTGRDDRVKDSGQSFSTIDTINTFRSAWMSEDPKGELSRLLSTGSSSHVGAADTGSDDSEDQDSGCSVLCC